jgi:hypothetical protein
MWIDDLEPDPTFATLIAGCITEGALVHNEGTTKFFNETLPLVFVEPGRNLRLFCFSLDTFNVSFDLVDAFLCFPLGISLEFV